MSKPEAPIAARRPTTRTHHNDEVVDHYEWLSDPQDPDTVAYLEAENTYTEARTEHLAGLREQIFSEIKARTQETDLSVPVRHGQWWYYARTVEGSQYAIQCRCSVTDPADWTPPELSANAPVPGEQILLDSNAEAEGHEFFSLGAFSLSDDENWLAWSFDTTGDERYTIRIKDLRTGKVLPDEITAAAPGATWSADGKYLFYTRVDEAWRPFQVWRHELSATNGGASDDVLVFVESDEHFFVGVGRSASEKYLMIGLSSKVTSEYRVLEADNPTGEFRVVLPRRSGIEYSIEHATLGSEEVFFVLHNDGSPNFEIATTPAADPGELTVVVPGSDSERIDDIDVFKRFVLISRRRDAVAGIAIAELTDDGLGHVVDIDFGEQLFTSGVGSNAEFDTQMVRVGGASFLTPSSVYDYEVATGRLLLRKQAPVLGGYDRADYQQSREWAVAEDGTRVPVSIVCRRDTARDGSAPALLYGYGSYEASMDPTFSAMRLSLLDRGFVFAIAHVRGGGELGRHWYESGKLLNKRNTFTDFIAVARHLVDRGWTSHERLVGEGGSAGGLLIGAVANLAGEAFAGLVAQVPFVDPLTTILDPSLPLTVIEWDEWGNPLENPDVYTYMKSYSPYENISATQYPAILAVTSLHDTRVRYVEPAKWVAQLRATALDSSNILLKTELNAGHGGVSGRYAQWRERAFELAWIIDTASANNGSSNARTHESLGM